MSPTEVEDVVVGRNNTAVVLAPTTLADILASSFAAYPTRVALDSESGSLDHAALAARVNRLARALIDHGVGPEVVVGLAMHRSIDLVVAMYAVTVAGGAYLPIDPDHPADRVAYILDHAAPSVVVVSEGTPEVVAGHADVIDLAEVDLGAYAATEVDDSERLQTLRPWNTAYVIYTSGSTGRPKGVAVPHSAIVNQLNWLSVEFRLASDDALLLRTQATFDLSVWEFWWAVTAGVRLVVAGPTAHRDPAVLADLIERRRVTVTTFVPSLLAAFLADVRPEQIAGLRQILCIGEALTADVVHRLRAVSSARVHNLYGPTEAAVSVTHQPVPAHVESVVGIGRPEWNTRVHVLDDRLHPVPDGVTGELYLAGDQLARGYLARPDLSADRFVADPSGPAGTRMYRTGDLVRWARVGDDPVPTLVYMGRSDFQVKVRGLRIELEEIERVLGAAPSVRSAVVTVHRDPCSGEHLVAYLVPAPGAAIDERAVLDAAAADLPSYMVPTVTVVLESLPLNINGKLDRRALPEPDLRGGTDHTPPSGPVEEIVAGLYADLTGVETVGAHDSFFAIGGNSLSATRAIARINAALGTDLTVRDLFTDPTVAGVAAAAERSASSDRPRLVAGPRPAQIPLSPAQSRMWFINQFDTTSPAYNIPSVIRLVGDLDVDALRAAVADVVARHEILRTHYPADAQIGGNDRAPRQSIADHDDAAARALLSVASVADHDALHTELIRLVSTGFDVAAQVPLRMALLSVASGADAAVTPDAHGSPGAGADAPRRDEHVLVVVVHHISGDGSSVTPLARDVMTAYSARRGGDAPGWPPLPVQYADYALWQRDLLGSEDDPESLASRQIGYWTTHLDSLPDVIDLPTDHPRPAVASTAGANVEFSVDAETHAGLTRLAGAHGATLFMVVHAALAVLLARSGTTDDIAIGTAIAGRGDADLDDLVGMFVNTLVLRSEIDPAEGFGDLLDRIRSTDIAAFTHTEIPFERLVEKLAPERTTAYSPLFQVVLAFGNTASDAEFELPGLTVSGLDTDITTTKFDLQLTVAPTSDAPGGLEAIFTYASALFERETVEAMAERFVAVLRAAVSDPTVPVGDIALLSPARTAQLASMTGTPPAPSRTFGEILDDAIAANPDGIAVVAGEETITYSELDRRITDLAAVLHARGVRTGSPVGLAIGRSIDSVVGFWSIVRAGGAVVPIDPNYPADRIGFMVADAAIRIGLTVDALRDRLPDTAQWLALDSGDAVAADGGAHRPPVAAAHLDATAYVIFTSGSTGRPKGVAVPHRGLADVVAEMTNTFDLGPDSTVLHFASPSFDASVFEMLLAVAAASTQVIAPADTFGGDELARLLVEHRVTHAFVTPAALATVPTDGVDALRVICVGGDTCPPDLVRRWAVGRSMYNLYGPSEATIWSTRSAAMDPALPLTIGGPISGVRATVLDERLQVVPPGVPGELYVSGPSVALGYLTRTAQTSASFVADPFGPPGSRMYRTGDLVRWRAGADGRWELEFNGRSDFQVKVRGFRIELGEIDAVIGREPDIGFTTTLGVPHPVSGQTMLVSYVHGHDGREVDTADLTARIAQRLPSHMVPTAIVVLDTVPLTPAGKFDRKALPAPTFVAADRPSRAPVSEIEERLCALFAETLGVPEVGVDDSFFALGGDSIMAIGLVSRARDAGLTFAPRDVFDRRTVAELAPIVDTEGGAADAVLPELDGGGVGSLPLTPIMRWLVDTRGEYRTFSQATFLTLPADPGHDRLLAALDAVLDRHDALRARLVLDGKHRLEIPPARSVVASDVLTRVVVDDLPGTDAFTATVQAAAAHAVDRLDPAAGRMISVVWFDPADELGPDARGRLYVVIHHLVVDGVSWRILLPDLAVAWGLTGPDGTPPDAVRPIGTSLRTWAHALPAAVATRHDELPHWTAVAAADDPDLGDRPLDPARDVAATLRRVEVAFDADVTRSLLSGVTATYRAGTDDALLTALALAVRRRRQARGVDASSLLIELEGHGREEDVVADTADGARADLFRTVGWFTSKYPVRIDLDGIDVDDALAGGPAAGTAFKAVKEQLASVPDNGIGFGLLTTFGGPGADALRSRPEPQIAFNYLGRNESGTESAAGDADFGWQAADDGGPLGGAMDDAMVVPAVLTINAVTDETPDGPRLSASFGYAGELLDHDEVVALADEWKRAAAGLAAHGTSADAGGLTPSDVPLVPVSQNDIDVIEAAHGGVEDIWPLAPLQAGLLYHAQLAGDDAVDIYTAQVVLELRGPVDADRMRAAVSALVAHNPVLRSAFHTSGDGTPVTAIADAVEVPWRVVDLTGHPDADAEADRLLRAHRLDRFDMSAPPLMRFLMLQVPAGADGTPLARLSMTNHHILLDGWSGPILLQQLFALYAMGGVDHLPVADTDYRDFLRWLSRRDPEAAMTSWRHALADLEGPTLLVERPTDPEQLRPDDIVPVEYPLAIDPETAAGLAELSRERGLTMNTMVQTAWGLVLARSTGADDVVFGVTVSGRPPELPGIGGMLGLFINTIPARVRLDQRETVIGLL
ncbi:MAG: amino acid adenylation domain-containing protein [Corynebacteriales bacterium]|nr:amino acid adenylation domain-containing protein [Mycobacteriales bacterium]